MKTIRRFLCVHGHYYQPPREDPFTGLVPRERGATPHHDFNEKIAAECYRPNAKLGNFEHTSFDLGPTLAAWLRRNERGTYRQILAQERRHLDRYGVSNALGHTYGHAILPLASEREKRIQIEWGLADFRHRFGHPPEGFWLPETAADTATLVALVEAGVRFTVLAPWQAKQPVDSGQPYWIKLPGGRRIAAFFYSGELSGAVSFDARTTINADVFGNRDLARQVGTDAKGPQLVLVATDGELYGHHQPYRDKFLTHLTKVSAPAQGFEVTTLSRFLRVRPPRREITLAGPGSWSCHHGVQRWYGTCGCTEGDGTWKTALRQSLDRLASRLDELYESEAAKLVSDPWAAEREYIGTCLGVETRSRFWGRHKLDGAQGRRRLFQLLGSQRFRHLMFASCAWFFDDLDRIEPRNAIACGLKALRDAEQVHGVALAADYAADLREVVSWRTERTGLDLLGDVLARGAAKTEDVSWAGRLLAG